MIVCDDFDLTLRCQRFIFSSISRNREY